DNDATDEENAKPTTCGNQKAREDFIHSWNDPDWSILDDRRGNLPEFPLDALSIPCQEWVTRAANGAGVTPAHVAVPLLGIASSLIGTARPCNGITIVDTADDHL